LSTITSLDRVSVVDERGVERVRIGAPLPDSIVEGKRGPVQQIVQ